MTPTNYNELVQMLSLVDPALFHGRRATVKPVPDTRQPPVVEAPPRMVPKEREEPLPFMAPVPQWTPPIPTRKPQPINQQPSGSYGATGPATSRELEARIKAPPSENPFKPRPGFWEVLSTFQQPQHITNLPPPNPVDKIVEQAAMLMLPMGRIGAGVRAVKGVSKSLPEMYSPTQWAQMARSGMNRLHRSSQGGFRNVADDAAPYARPRSEVLPYSKPQRTLTQELREIHARAPKAARPVKEIMSYSAKDKKRVRDAAIEARKREELIRQLKRKGELDAGARRLIYGD